LPFLPPPNQLPLPQATITDAGALLPHLTAAAATAAAAAAAAWVRAASVRDLVFRISCPTCSSVSCWASLICSACASIAAWSYKTKVFLGLPGGLFIARIPAPVAQPVPHLLAVAWVGRLPAAVAVAAAGAGRRPGGLSSLVTCSNPKTLFACNPTPTRRVQKDINLMLTAVTPQGKNNNYAGCFRKGM